MGISNVATWINSSDIIPIGVRHEVMSPWEVNIDSRRIAFQDQLTGDEYQNLIMDDVEDVIHHRLQTLN
jgi:hypothetical protein